MTTENKVLLDLLALSLSPEHEYEARLDNIRKRAEQCENENIWMNIVFNARKHSVLSLLYDVMHDIGGVPTLCISETENRARKVCLTNYRLLAINRKIIKEFGSAGIRYCILKGPAIAENYPVPILRKSGDADILILDRKKIKQAQEILEACGFSANEEQYTNHHIEYENAAGDVLELHTMLSEPFDDRHVNKYIEKVAEECSNNIVYVDVLGVKMPVLARPYNAYELLLHMLQHFLGTGFGLKLLCDWTLFWNKREDNADRDMDVYVRLVTESGMKGFSDMVTVLCIKYLGLKYECVSGMNIDKSLLNEGRRIGDEALSDVNRQKKDESRQTTLSDTDEMMEEILSAGEFGAYSEGRMVALRGTGITAYIREFHHQMHLNFPKAGKIFVLWPVLWIITLIKFLNNNRKMRKGTSLKDYMASAGKRGNIVKRMKLFEIEK